MGRVRDPIDEVRLPGATGTPGTPWCVEVQHLRVFQPWPLLDRLRPHWTHTLHCLTRHTDPARGSDPEWQGPISEGDPVNREKAVILGNSAPSSMHQFATPSHPHGSPQTQRVELRSNRSRPDY